MYALKFLKPPPVISRINLIFEEATRPDGWSGLVRVRTTPSHHLFIALLIGAFPYTGGYSNEAGCPGAPVPLTSCEEARFP